MIEELCGDTYEIPNLGTIECARKRGHAGWHKEESGGMKWQRKTDLARDAKRRRAREEAIEFVRALAEDPRSVPWAVTARELVRKMDDLTTGLDAR